LLASAELLVTIVILLEYTSVKIL